MLEESDPHVGANDPTLRAELDVRPPRLAVDAGLKRHVGDLDGGNGEPERLAAGDLEVPEADAPSIRYETEVDVRPRIERKLAVVGGEAAGQREPLVPLAEAEAVAYLVPGLVPAPDWSRRILDAHQEGYAVVAGSIEADGRRARRALAQWAPGTGRVPTFSGPLLCPSIVRGVEPDWIDEVEGVPAAARPREEPWLYDGRITARLESGRRRG